MALSQQNKQRLHKLAGRSLAGYTDLVVSTSRLVTEPADYVQRMVAAHPCIIAMWHGQFLLIPPLSPAEISTRIMVARHKDADILGHALSRRPHLGLIRGAGAGSRARDRGGASALRAALRALEEGHSFAMTADVPPGPARQCGLGIITLARLSGRPILPVAVASSRYKSLDTWSRLTINLPFSKLGAVVCEPIVVPRDADAATQEALRQAVGTALNTATTRAYALAGADPARSTPPAARGAEGAPAEPGFSLKAYRRLTGLARPVLPVLLGMRERQGKEDPARRGERLGQASHPRPDGMLIWIHAASVGETNAILPLIDVLQQARPAARFLLTTGTRTSAELAARRLGPNAVHQYVPLDAREYVNRFLDHWRPDLGVFTESEIWPNLVLAAHARGVPLALVNARMSNRSFGRWRKRPGLSRPIFNRFEVVLAQNEKLARRFGELGARRTIDAGNLKVDAPPPPVDAAELERLRSALAGRPLLVAASTHDGEDKIIAAAHRQIARALPGFCTIIAPRHPERGPVVAEQLKSMGLSVTQRSLGALPSPGNEVYIADTIGELGTLYALAPVAFIGGSLVDRGGQNPIEAVRHGAAVLTGPHWGNFQDAYRALLRHKGAIEVRSADDMASVVVRLMQNPAELQAMHTGAGAALQTLAGALSCTVEALLAVLTKHEGASRAA